MGLSLGFPPHRPFFSSPLVSGFVMVGMQESCISPFSDCAGVGVVAGFHTNWRGSSVVVTVACTRRVRCECG